MSEGGAEHATRYLDFPIRDDPAAFNNASSAELRAHFKTWRSSNEAFEEQQMGHSEREELWLSMRYRYFIRVDAEAVQNILDAANGHNSGAWVDLVQVDWPDSESDEDEEEDEHADHGFTDGFPPVEDMTTYEVGFQRVPVTDLYPTCWMDKENIPEKWYSRPPKMTYKLP
jgi:hypothetical protein